MAFMINKNLVFVDSLQFIKSNLDLLVKKSMSEDFKYLSEEFSGEYLRLLKEEGVYPYEYMDSLCHYFSAPGLSWDAMLKMTKI